ncbi:hypothetical protein SAMN05216358_0064 [Rhizobium sp. AN5]|uniref:hypothetical protein n=1 Tax=Rhizobium sp. AN5 TaxID=1855304 RepID=UPI000BCF6DA1|nr:hypothetical protein [Rhizobium sp. AN5]SOC90045.1 hypothetical protein SAMN05216358_0064 [Rhizobium sp. AN5]
MTEATEIQVFAMHGDRIAERGETIDYYDILVRADGNDGEIIEIEEHEDMSEDEMNVVLTELEIKYGLSADFIGG